MNKRNSIMITCLLGFIAAPALAAEKLPMLASHGEQGVASSLRMSLSPVTPEKPGEFTVFRVSLENAGDKDLMLNLGMMLANGKVMMPTAIHLILVDAKGGSRELLFSDRRYPGVAGRVDDFIVPLRAGSTYSLCLSLNDYWCPKTKEFQIALRAGEYRIHAVLDGQGAQHVNSDTAGMKLMNIWQGRLSSAPIVIRIGQ